MYVDLDAICFMMFIKKNLTLFGIMAHLTNQNVIINNLPKFDDWFHMIFDPLVMKVYNENDVHKKDESKDELENNLRPTFGMTLTYSPNNLTLS